MTIQQPDQSKKAANPTGSQTSDQDKTRMEPEPNNPMSKFNKALQKIFSAPKEDLNKK